MNKEKENKIIGEWIIRNGAAQFDTKNRNVILNDGGLFYIEKNVKIKPKTKMILSKAPQTRIINGHKQKVFPVFFRKIKRNGRQVKEKIEYYSANLWFEEIDDIILYFKKMKSLLNKLGYKTNYKKK